MSGGGSVRALLLRVLILTVVLLALSRWTGRGARPVTQGQARTIRPDPSAQDPGTEQMSAPGDLTFYKTLGSGGLPATGGFSAEPTPGHAGAPRVEGAAAPGGAPPSSPSLTNNKDTVRTLPGQASLRSPAYIVQALATRDAGVARRMRDRLAERGFPAIVMEDRSGRQVVYRVRAGRYLTRPEADAAARVLRRARLRPWVLQDGL